MKFRILIPVLAVAFAAAVFARAQGELKDDEYQTIAQATQSQATTAGSSASMKQWFDRITIGGDVGVGYVVTGKNGTEPNGLFYLGGNIYGANLFVDADLGDGFWGHTTLSVTSSGLGVEELYAEAKDFLHSDGLVSAKLGRMDVPYGEEYLWQYPFENPMVLRTVAWPWDEDQGVEAFGKAGQFSYIAAVMTGSSGAATGPDDTADYSIVTRVSYDPANWLHLGASAMENGNHASSAEAFNFVHIVPVPGSPDTTVDFQAYEADLTLKFAHMVKLSGDGGLVDLNDVAPYNRTIYYFYGQAQVNLTDELYACGRYSGIGTFDSTQGYKFGGDYDGAYGLSPTPSLDFDTESLSRAGIALGYKFNESTLLKVEFDEDAIGLISKAPASEVAAAGGNRATFATEFDIKF